MFQSIFLVQIPLLNRVTIEIRNCAVHPSLASDDLEKEKGAYHRMLESSNCSIFAIIMPSRLLNLLVLAIAACCVAGGDEDDERGSGRITVCYQFS